MKKNKTTVTDATVASVTPPKRLIEFNDSHFDYIALLAASYNVSYSFVIYCIIEAANADAVTAVITHQVIKTTSPLKRLP